MATFVLSIGRHTGFDACEDPKREDTYRLDIVDSYRLDMTLLTKHQTKSRMTSLSFRFEARSMDNSGCQVPWSLFS